MQLYHNCPDQINSNGQTFIYFGSASKFHPKPNQTKPNQGVKYRTINVLSKNLRGKTDLHGQPYKAHKFYYILKS